MRYVVWCTFLIWVGAMHVLGVVDLLSGFVDEGWQGSLGLPRRGCTWCWCGQHCSCQLRQRAIWVAALRSAMLGSYRSFVAPPGRPSDDSSTPGRKLCPSSAAGTPQHCSINLSLIIRGLGVDPARALRSGCTYFISCSLLQGTKACVCTQDSTTFGLVRSMLKTHSSHQHATAGSQLSIRSPGL